MARKKKTRGYRPQGDILAFDADARARGMTYAQAQVQETCREHQHRRRVPEDYHRAGARF